MAGPKTAAETEQEEGKSKLDISSDGGAPCKVTSPLAGAKEAGAL